MLFIQPKIVTLAKSIQTWVTKDDKKYDVPTENCDVHKVVEIEVPNVVGKKLSEAKKILEDKKLKVEVVYEENKKKDDGIVLKQSVKDKEKVKEGAIITITVNKIKNNDNNDNNNDDNEKPTNTQTNTQTNTDSGNTTTNVVNDTITE